METPEGGLCGCTRGGKNYLRQLVYVVVVRILKSHIAN